VLLLPKTQNSPEIEILAVVTLGLFAGVVFAATAILRVNAQRFPDRIARTLVGLQLAVKTLLQQKTAALLALVITTATQGLFIFQNVLIAHAVGIHVPVAAWLVAFPLAKLAAFLPVSLGGLGVREGVIAAVLLPFSIPATLAIAQSLVWQTVTLATGLAGGLAALLLPLTAVSNWKRS
jgi:uncharacterized protein (TIRG00374 family)